MRVLMASASKIHPSLSAPTSAKMPNQPHKQCQKHQHPDHGCDPCNQTSTDTPSSSSSSSTASIPLSRVSSDQALTVLVDSNLSTTVSASVSASASTSTITSSHHTFADSSSVSDKPDPSLSSPHDLLQPLFILRVSSPTNSDSESSHDGQLDLEQPALPKGSNALLVPSSTASAVSPRASYPGLNHHQQQQTLSSASQFPAAHAAPAAPASSPLSLPRSDSQQHQLHDQHQQSPAATTEQDSPLRPASLAPAFTSPKPTSPAQSRLFPTAPAASVSRSVSPAAPSSTLVPASLSTTPTQESNSFWSAMTPSSLFPDGFSSPYASQSMDAMLMPGAPFAASSLKPALHSAPSQTPPQKQQQRQHVDSAVCADPQSLDKSLWRRHSLPVHSSIGDAGYQPHLGFHHQCASDGLASQHSHYQQHGGHRLKQQQQQHGHHSSSAAAASATIGGMSSDASLPPFQPPSRRGSILRRSSHDVYPADSDGSMAGQASLAWLKAASLSNSPHRTAAGSHEAYSANAFMHPFHQMQSQAPYPTASTAGTTASHGYQPRSLMARGPSTITSPAVVKSLAFNAQPSDAINASESLWSSQVVSQPDDLPPAHASLHSIHSRTNSGGSSFGSNGSNSGSSSSARTSVRSSIACTCSASSPLGEMCPACTLAAASSASSGAVNGGHRGSFGSGGGGPTSAATGSAGYMNGFMNRTRIHTSGAGYNPDLSRPSPFRRHSLDTFASCPAGQYDALLVSHMGQLPHGLLSPTSPTTRRSSASSAASSSTLYTNDHPLSRKGQPTAAVECKDPSIGPSPSTAAPEAGSTGGVAQAPPCETTSPRDMRIVAEIQTSNFPVDSAKLTSEYFDCLTREAQRLCIELVPSQEMFQLQRTVFLMLQDAVRLVFSDAVLDCAGAIVSGFSQPGAELDFCLVLPSISGSVAACGAQYIERLGNALKNAGIKEIKVLTRARVPICKLRDPMTGIPCDIGIQSSLWTHITRLLRTYACIDSRVQELSIVIRHWAKNRGINEPSFGTLSSYCYTLMLIHVLQLRGVLPCLQSIVDPDKAAVLGSPPTVLADGDFNVYFYDDLSLLPRFWVGNNTETVGELLVAFFKYYACEFPYVHGVVSIRTGSVLSKDDKGWTKQSQQEQHQGVSGAGKDRFWLCVEDPFETTHNVGRPVDKETLYDVRGEFIRASKILCGGPAYAGEMMLAKVCERVPALASSKRPSTGPLSQTQPRRTW